MISAAARRALLAALGRSALPLAGGAGGAYAGSELSSDPTYGAIGGALLGGAGGYGVRAAVRRTLPFIADEVARVRAGVPRADWPNMRKQALLEQFGLGDYQIGRLRYGESPVDTGGVDPGQYDEFVNQEGLAPPRNSAPSPFEVEYRIQRQRDLDDIFGDARPTTSEVIASGRRGDAAGVAQSVPSWWLPTRSEPSRGNEDTLFAMPDPSAMARRLRGPSGRKAMFDYAEVARLVRERGMSIHTAARTLGIDRWQDVQTIRANLRRAIKRGTIEPLPEHAWGRARTLFSQAYSVADLVAEAGAQGARGGYRTVSEVYDALGGAEAIANHSTLVTQITRLQGAAKRAVADGPAAIEALAKEWVSTPAAVAAFAARPAPKARAKRNANAGKSVNEAMSVLLPYLLAGGAYGGLGAALSTVADREARRRAILDQMSS